jgi:hypothetical protein
MPRDINQKMRFSKEELELMKGLFSDNEELVFAIRKVMLQLDLNLGEQAVLNGLTDEGFAVIKKLFLPEFDGDSPITQLADLRIGLDIKSLSPDGAWPMIKAKELEIDYIKQQLEQLRDRGEVKIKLSDLGDLSGNKPTREQVYINFTAWNFLVSFVDGMINQLKILSGLKTESVEETLKRLAATSNK